MSQRGRAAPLSRRSLLAGAGGLAALAGCGGVRTDEYTGPPRRGGTLRVGALGSAAAVTEDPYSLIGNESDMLILSLVFDPLTAPGPGAVTAPRLAASWRSDPEQRAWTFAIAKGARFHDGSPITAEDVVWSLRTLRDRPGGDWKVPVPPDGVVAAGPDQVRLVSEQPNSKLPLLLREMTFVLKAGSSGLLTSSTGSGPFVLESYDDGDARLRRNPDWYAGPPLLDGIQVVRFDNASALANAVSAGQIDLASNVGALAARTAGERPGLEIVRRRDDLVIPLALRTSDGPYRDPRVREAIRLGVDRKALVRQVFSGYGSVGNDVLGIGDPAYDRGVPQRERDVDKAAALLRAAEFDTAASYTCYTKDQAIGEVDSARLIAAQLKDIGMKIEVSVQETTTFAQRYRFKAPMTTTSWGTNDSLYFYAGKVLSGSSSANETSFHDPEFDGLYAQALSAPDGPAQDEALRGMQRIQHERGGYVVWGVADGVDVASVRVRDLPKLAGYGRVQLERVWMSP